MSRQLPDAWAAGQRAWSVWAVGLSLSLLACHAKESPPPVQNPVVQVQPGGWSPTDPWSPEVQEAARYAVQTYAVTQRSRLLYKDVLASEQQVVAGLNFKLTLTVLQDKTPHTAQVTVWRQLSGRYQLTQWNWLD